MQKTFTPEDALALMDRCEVTTDATGSSVRFLDVLETGFGYHPLRAALAECITDRDAARVALFEHLSGARALAQYAQATTIELEALQRGDADRRRALAKTEAAVENEREACASIAAVIHGSRRWLSDRIATLERENAMLRVARQQAEDRYTGAAKMRDAFIKRIDVLDFDVRGQRDILIKFARLVATPERVDGPIHGVAVNAAAEIVRMYDEHKRRGGE